VHGHLHAQLLAGERRGHVEQGRVLRQAERIAVELERRQRAREAGDRHRVAEARFQERRGHQVADGQRALGLGGAQRALEHRVVAEGLGQPGEVQRVEEEALQRALRRIGRGREVLGHGGVGGLQRAQEALGNLVAGLVGGLLRLLHGVPLAEQARQRAAQRRGRHAVRLFERGAFERRGVHAARALQQVVRLVDQHGHAPVGVAHGGVQEGAAVEVVVVVAHDGVGPVGHFLREEIGAHLVRQRNVAQRRAVEPGGLRGLLARGRQAVVEAAGQRAGVAVAGAVGVLADLFARRELEHAQPARPSALVEHAQRIERHRPARGLGGEEEDLVDLARFAARLEQREDGGQRLADAGGRLRHEAAPAHGRAVHGLGQFALAGAEVAVRKFEPGQRGVERAAVAGLAGAQAL
jgi:hypothetical protein